MKIVTLFITLFVVQSAVAQTTVRTGSVNVGYNSELDVPVAKALSVSYSGGEAASLTLEGEELLVGTKEETKISAYSAKPVKFFYYVLELRPSSSADHGIVLERKGNITRYCGLNKGNAVLTAYKGDGTKANFCVTL